MIKHLQCKAYPEVVENNNTSERCVRWYGSVTDVSETSNSLNEYQQLIERANAPIVGVDTNLNINDWNAKIEQLTGYTKSQVMGTSIMELILPDNKVEVEEILRKALSGNETSNYQLPFKTNTNDMIDLLINSSSRRDVNGKIMGVIGIGQDLTQLKKEIVNKNIIAMICDSTNVFSHGRAGSESDVRESLLKIIEQKNLIMRVMIKNKYVIDFLMLIREM